MLHLSADWQLAAAGERSGATEVLKRTAEECSGISIGMLASFLERGRQAKRGRTAFG